MDHHQVKSYISNWHKFLQEKGIKGLVSKFGEFEYFEFRSEKILGSDASYVHAYIGLSDDHAEVKLFVISDIYDTNNPEHKIEDHIVVCSPVFFRKGEKLQEEISEKKALKRIRRWQKSPYTYLKGKLSSEYNAVRCFTIPMEDLLSPIHRAYFAIKKAKAIPGLDYQMDLIIKNMDVEGMQESNSAYDTIRLVPPFPPTTRYFYLLESDEQ